MILADKLIEVANYHYLIIGLMIILAAILIATIFFVAKYYQYQLGGYHRALSDLRKENIDFQRREKELLSLVDRLQKEIAYKNNERD